MEATETRQVGKHLFIFEKDKDNANKNNRTLIASCVGSSSDADKLPSEFVSYMRKLFDILDEDKRGFVKLSDIEERWGARNGTPSSAIVENLRRVTPSDGLLSFERLCLGFQLALRPTERNLDSSRPVSTEHFIKDNQHGGIELKPHVQCHHGDEVGEAKVGEGMRPRRPRSMVQLRQQKEPLDLALAKRKGGILEGIAKTDKKTIVEKLRQWKREERLKEKKLVDNNTVSAISCTTNVEKTHCRQAVLTPERKGNDRDGDGRHSKQNSTRRDQCSRLPRVRVHYKGETVNKDGLNGGSRDAAVQRDSRLAKETKLRDLDEELQVLGEGLRAVEEVRDWFFTRITAVQEEKLYVKSVNKYSVQNFESMIHDKRRQELGLSSSNWENVASCIDELKIHLGQMMKKPFSLPTNQSSESASKQKINQLERDKRALIRELFQYKSQHDKLINDY